MEYKVIRSKRKTIALEVKPDGRIYVRAPKRMKDPDIAKFIASRTEWLTRALAKAAESRAAAESAGRLSAAEIDALKREAKRTIPARAAHYADLLGVTYGRVTIRMQKSKWGSCSAKGDLNFNCLLMLAPPKVLDSVVVHELCHRKEMNHSSRFYAAVLSVMPDYRARDAWLKKHGAELMSRAFGN